MRIVFFIPAPIVSRGKNAGKQVPYCSGNHYVSPIVRRSRTKRHRAQAAEEAFRIRQDRGLAPCTERRKVTAILIRAKRQRFLDREQVFYACKPYVDGLRDAELIKDDNPKWVDYDAIQHKDNEQPPGVWFVIEDAAVTA